MPLATIKVIEGVFSAEEKRRLIEKVTEAMVSIEGEALRDKTVVVLEEVRSADWAVGGKTFTAEDVRRLRGSRLPSPRSPISRTSSRTATRIAPPRAGATRPVRAR